MADGSDAAAVFPPLSSGRERERSPRKAWLHLASSSVSSAGLPSPTPTSHSHHEPVSHAQQHQQRKRPQPLKTSFVLGPLESRESNGATPTTDPPVADDIDDEGTTPGGSDAACCKGASARSAASDVTADTRFPFISPVEPVLTLARFHRSLNKVYIPLDDDEELEVGEAGFRSLNGAGSNFALLGTPGSSLLGGGAFGQVFKAIHFPTMRRVAIKKIPKDFGRSHEYANSFARELRNLYHNVQQLSTRATPKVLATGRPTAAGEGVEGHCPYLLTLYDAYIERNPTNLCLVLEFMEGGSLEQVMAAQGGGGCDDEGFVLEVAHNVLKGLHHLHQRGYLHQDVKPGNVLLTADRFAKLADFGLTVAVSGSAAEAEEEETGRSGPKRSVGSPFSEAVAVGTARYWPPELWGAEKRRDASGRGDVWGLGLTIMALINGKEPLESCSTRSQVDIELFEAAKEAAASGKPAAQVAEERGIFSRKRLAEFSPALQDFVDRCLRDLSLRPPAAELLQHAFIQQYCKAGGSRQRELDEAVKALKTHIQIHKEWKITPQMVELLAKELRIKSSDMREYLDAHLEPGLLLSSTTSSSAFKDAHSSPASAAGEPCGGSTITPGSAGSDGGRLDFSFSGVVVAEEAPTPLGRTNATAVTAVEGPEEGLLVVDGEPSVEDDSLQATLLRQYDELDRLRSEVIPPMEDLVEELRRQVKERDERLVEAHQEIADLRRRLQKAEQAV